MSEYPRCLKRIINIEIRGQILIVSLSSAAEGQAPTSPSQVQQRHLERVDQVSNGTSHHLSIYDA